MSCTPGRWTCPRCLPGSHTFTAYGSDGDTKAAIKAVQERHRDLHQAEAVTLTRLGLGESHPPRRRKKAA